MKAKILRLQQAMREMPQARGLETKHHFADGMYARELFRPAGTLIVGKVHKREHFYIVMTGRVAVTMDDRIDRTQIIHAPAVLVSAPGTKRAVLALEDSTCMTVHRTSLTDLDEIEQELIEPEADALFDARNNVKELPLCPG